MPISSLSEGRAERGAPFPDSVLAADSRQDGPGDARPAQPAPRARPVACTARRLAGREPVLRVRCALTSMLVFPKTKGSFEKPRLEMCATLSRSASWGSEECVTDFIAALIVSLTCLGFFALVMWK